nr:DbpA RNA binding domain-containing protein [Ktedonobacterales bacterium]
GLGYLAQAIHGEINQAQRERALGRFRAGHTQLLVATDVAARGLDIPDVSHIINYDLPLDADSYVHRIGRTGRAGKAGEALTLVTPRERRQLRFIEQSIHRNLERLRLPTRADVAARRRAAFREEVLAILDGGQLDSFLALVGDLAGTHDPAEVAAAAFKMAAQARETRRPGYGDIWTTPAAPEPAAPTAIGGMSEASEGERPQGRGRREGRAPDPGQHPRRGRGEPAMARLFLRVGRQDGVRPADLVGAIANEAGIPGDAIGDIDIYDAFSFVEVPEDTVEAVRAALNRTTIRGRPPRATLARPDDGWRERADDERPPRRPGAPGSRWNDEREARPRPLRPRSFDREGEDPRRPLRAPGMARRTPFGHKPAGRRT